MIYLYIYIYVYTQDNPFFATSSPLTSTGLPFLVRRQVRVRQAKAIHCVLLREVLKNNFPDAWMTPVSENAGYHPGLCGDYM